MKLFFLFFCLVISLNSFAQSLKPDQLMMSYDEMSKTSLADFEKIAENTWIQKFDTEGMYIFSEIDENGNEVVVTRRFPYGFLKELKFSIAKDKNDYYFGMIGGTWEGIDTGMASGGGGYARPIPVKKMGFKQIGTTISFFIWGREEYFASKESKRMYTDLLNPIISTVTNTLDLEKALEKDPDCIKILSENPYLYPSYCAVIHNVRFDYLIIDAELNDLTKIKVRGKNLNQAEDVFSIDFKSKIEQLPHSN